MQELTMSDWSNSEFSYVHGDAYDVTPGEIALSSLKYIYTDLTDIKRSYFRLGFHLSEFDRYFYYQQFGFSSMEEMAIVNFGMDKSALSRCLNVYRRFCQKEFDSMGVLKTMKNYYDDRYNDFSYSQLVEMLPLKDDVIQKITPDMSVRQIRELKKKKQGSKVATSQPKNEEPKNEESSPKLSDSYAPDDKVVIERLFGSIADFLYDAGFMPGELSERSTAKQISFELLDGKVLTVRLSFSKSDSSK